MNAPEKAMAQARVSPVVAGGAVRGYRLAGVRKESAVAGLGFRDGDVITSVNGYEVGDQAQALALYMSLGSASTLRVRYERGGRAETKVVRVI